MFSGSLRRISAVATIVVLTALSAVLPATAEDSIVLRGRVFQDDGLTPRAGVVIALVDPGDSSVVRSEPTSGEGAFSVETDVAGSYLVVAETDDGAFVTGENLQLRSGVNTPVSLTLTESNPAVQIAPGQTVGTLAPWKWVVAGLIGVSALLVIEDAGSDSESTASAF